MTTIIDVYSLSPSESRALALATHYPDHQALQRQGNWLSIAAEARHDDVIITGPRRVDLWKGVPAGVHVRVWPDDYAVEERHEVLISVLVSHGVPLAKARTWLKKPPVKQRQLFEDCQDIAEALQANWHRTPINKPTPAGSYTGDVPSAEEIHTIFHEPRNEGLLVMSLDTETTGLDPFSDEIVGVSLATYWHPKGVYFPLTHKDNPDFPHQELLNAELGAYNGILIGHNAKFDYHFIKQCLLTDVHYTDDTQILAWLCGFKGSDEEAPHGPESGIGLKNLTRKLLGREPTEIKSLGISKKKTMADVPWRDAADYAAQDADNTLALYNKLKVLAKERGVWDLYTNLEMPTMHVLCKMEERGIAVDPDQLTKMTESTGHRLSVIQQRANQLCNRPVNMRSMDDVTSALADRGWKSNNRTATGKPSLRKADIANETEPLIELLREHKQQTKLLNAFLDPMYEMGKAHHWVIHPTFNQTGTLSGRFSCSNPNLQQQPAEMRQVFVARPDYKLIGADYSQLELRILAWITGDEGLIDVFRKGEDIHDAVQSRLGLKDRRVAKNIGYGIVYGADAPKLAETAGISIDEARAILTDYLAAYPRVRSWIADTKAEARRSGVVRTAWQRPRWLPNARAADLSLRAEAERQAVNHCIQGTAADLAKYSMLLLDAMLTPMGAHLLLQIHDEFIVEAPEYLVDEVTAVIKEAMESNDLDPVPLTTSVHVGDRWSDLK